ncbi:carbohydrate ABC transporter permease [Cellulomonas hominis]
MSKRAERQAEQRVVDRPVVLRDSRGYRTFRVVNGIALVVICLVMLYPFANVIAQSFSAEAYITRGQISVWPRGFNVDTYERVMADRMFWINYRNTVVYTVVATSIAIVLTTTYAYVLSKHQLRGRTFLIGAALLTMFFNGGLIPNYILINQLGFKNTIWAIVLPNAISVFNLLVMKSFFENQPEELEEAAEVDGLSTYGRLRRIVLPLSKAVIATMLLFYSVSFWNSWFSAFLYMDDKEMYPVTVYLRNLLASANSATSVSGGSTDNITQVASNIRAVTMTLTVLPILAVYPFVQRHFVSGVMLGAVKG